VSFILASATERKKVQHYRDDKPRVASAGVYGLGSYPRVILCHWLSA